MGSVRGVRGAPTRCSWRVGGRTEVSPWTAHGRLMACAKMTVLKRNTSRGNSLSDELKLSSVLGEIRAYLGSPPTQKVTFGNSS